MSAPPGIVYRDERLAVVEKPAGLVVHPAPGHRAGTLVDALGELLGGGDRGRPGIVHRLDRDTSGLMIVARDAEAHRRLSAMIKAREVRRAYLALIEGHPRSRSGTIDAPLGRDRRAPTRRAVGGRGARAARTHFELIEALPDDSLVEARSRRGERTRSGPTSRRSGTPSAGILATAPPAGTGSGASSCTALGSSSRIRSRASGSPFARRCRTTWRPRSSAPAADAAALTRPDYNRRDR